MTLTKREQKIAWVVGGVVAIGLIFLLVNNLYLGTLDDVESQITNAQKKERDDSNTLEKAKVRNQQWENMDILSDPAAMGQLVHDHVTDLAGQARIQVSNWRAQAVTRPVPHSDIYQEATFDLQARGNTAGFAKFLYTLESSKTPMRVDRMDVSSQPLGQDDLNITLALTALIYAPKPVKGAPTATQVARSTSTKPGAATKAGESAAEKAIIEKLKAQRAADEKAAGNATAAPSTAPAAVPGAASAPAALPSAAESQAADDAAEAKLKKQREQELETLDAPATTPATAPAGGVR